MYVVHRSIGPRRVERIQRFVMIYGLTQQLRAYQRFLTRRMLRLGLAMFLYSGAVWPALAQTAPAITIIVGYSPGGVYDVQARLLAQFMSRHLPGQPTILVQNMPGAGSLKAANYLYQLAPRDGSQFGSFANGLILQQLLAPQGIQFDARKFRWLGSSMSEMSIVYAWHTTKFRTLEDVRRGEMVVPGTGSGANSVVFPKILNKILGTRFRVVSGYPGAAETMLAIERGEADGHAGGTWANLVSSKPGWVSEGKVRILAQLGLTPLPELRAVPLVVDMVPDPTDRAALALLFSKQAIAFPFAAPPGTPEERVVALRQAFARTIEDPDFRREAATHNIDTDLVRGEAVEALVNDIFSRPPEIIERARALLNVE
jgi:tripartite-type tricarboxylate transporter receptor subunit TctC